MATKRAAGSRGSRRKKTPPKTPPKTPTPTKRPKKRLGVIAQKVADLREVAEATRRKKSTKRKK